MAVLALVAPACGPNRSTGAVPPAHRVTVVASLFPLAEVARRVGLNRVTVTDLTATGTEPRTVTVSGADLEGAVVLMLGRGYQPALEAAARNGPAKPDLVVTVWDEVGGRHPNVWLDPTVMVRVTMLVADALSRADPEGRTAYRDGARSYSAQLGALDIDYRSSLADCSRRDVVTADSAFAPLASRYGFVDHAVEEAGVLRLVQARGVPTIFTEPMVPPEAALALAQAAHASVDSLATLETRTAKETARGASYLSLMTDNLAKLRTALACAGGAGG